MYSICLFLQLCPGIVLHSFLLKDDIVLQFKVDEFTSETIMVKRLKMTILFVAEINCGWPQPFWNGYLIGQETNVGSIIFFR